MLESLKRRETLRGRMTVSKPSWSVPIIIIKLTTIAAILMGILFSRNKTGRYSISMKVDFKG